jgi:hypothetical protein
MCWERTGGGRAAMAAAAVGGLPVEPQFLKKLSLKSLDEALAGPLRAAPTLRGNPILASPSYY